MLLDLLISALNADRTELLNHNRKCYCWVVEESQNRVWLVGKRGGNQGPFSEYLHATFRHLSVDKRLEVISVDRIVIHQSQRVNIEVNPTSRKTDARRFFGNNSPPLSRSFLS